MELDRKWTGENGTANVQNGTYSRVYYGACTVAGYCVTYSYFASVVSKSPTCLPSRKTPNMTESITTEGKVGIA